MKIIHEKCDPKLAEDKKLPYTAYLIQYEVEGKVEHDIATVSYTHLTLPTICSV